MKYPNISLVVDREGPGSNAFLILGNAKRAMQKAGIDEEAISEFFNEAMSSDYEHLLATCNEWFDFRIKDGVTKTNDL